MGDAREVVVDQEEWRFWTLIVAGHLITVPPFLLLGAVSGRLVPWLIPLVIMLAFQYTGAIRGRRRRWSDPPRCIVGAERIG